MVPRLLLRVVAGAGIAAGGGLLGGCTGFEPPEPREVAELRETFAVDGQPVPPAAVRLFSAHTTPVGPVVHAIDLTAAARSEAFDDIALDGEWVRTGSGYGYRVLGTLDDGTHVVETVDGDQRRVLFLKFEGRWQADESPRLLMRCVGHHVVGADQTVTLRGDRVRVE